MVSVYWLLYKFFLEIRSHVVHQRGVTAQWLISGLTNLNKSAKLANMLETTDATWLPPKDQKHISDSDNANMQRQAITKNCR